MSQYSGVARVYQRGLPRQDDVHKAAAVTALDTGVGKVVDALKEAEETEEREKRREWEENKRKAEEYKRQQKRFGEVGDSEKQEEELATGGG